MRWRFTPPAVLMVGCIPCTDVLRHREDLLAVAAGLAALWSSPPVIMAESVSRLCGFTRDSELVAVVYLGWPSGERAPLQPRTEQTIVWRDSE